MAYVYEHWRPDKGVCFYVGKGTGRRSKKISNSRNVHHERIVRKLRRLDMEVEIRIIADGLSDAEALAMEIKRIAFYGLDNLANQTAGGEGLLRPTADVRKKMSDAVQKRLADPEFRERHRQAVRNSVTPERRKRAGDARRGKKLPGSTGAKISLALKGKLRPHMAERAKGAGNPFFGKKHSEETLARISAKKRGTKLSEETKAKMRLAQQARRAMEIATGTQPVRPTGWHHTPEAIEKMKCGASERNSGRTTSEEAKRKISEKGKGRRHTPETIEKMKVAAKGRRPGPAARAALLLAITGVKRAPITEETKARMRAAWVIRRQKKQEAG